MSFGTISSRIRQGTAWTWIAEKHKPSLPTDLATSVMDLEALDRLHAKQGRSTARVVFHGPSGPLPVYLKRHFRLTWRERLAALLNPSGRHTPGGAEFAHLATVQSLGVLVPEVIAAGERIGPWGHVQSFLMVAELTGCEPLHEAIPQLKASLDPDAFARLKRELTIEMAVITAKLHASKMFHKDLYLCHFYLDMSLSAPIGSRLRLIDLHRLGEHKLTAIRWRFKDLGQLLYSTVGVAGVERRDLLRFWQCYRQVMRLRLPRWQMWLVYQKSARYLDHNERRGGRS